MLNVIFSDLKKQILIASTIVAFAFISSFIICLGLLLSNELLNKIDDTMERGKTPHFLQMHAGSIDNVDFSSFASNPMVEDFQIQPFLNIDNNEFLVDGKPFIFSSDDNGVTIQSRSFDFLLAEDGSIINVDDGIYVPTYYKNSVELGSKLTICGQDFIVKGYLIDSQMGSSLSSSKRFLINEESYQKLRDKGSEEFLIEARAVSVDDINAISNLYALSELPKDGPAVTYSLIRLMNALSDGLMIILIIISGILAMLISLVALRYIFLISIERDGKRIALIQAIGIRRDRLILLYSFKYLILLLLGSTLSLITLLLMLENASILILLGGHLIIFIILTLWDYLIMRRISKIDILDEIRNSNKKSNGIISLALVSILTAIMYCLAFIPASAASTLASKEFVSSMGIGNADIRMDLKGENRSDIEEYLSSSSLVDSYEIYDTYRVKVEAKEQTLLMLIEKGNHSLFQLKYIKGCEPINENEIALSQLLANECSVAIGDKLNILGKEYIVKGIYGDITNGGKTAKVTSIDQDTPIWSIAYINSNSPDDLVSALLTAFSKAKTGKIEDYVISLYGNTINSINKAKYIALFVCLFIELVLVTLISALTVERDSRTIALKLAIGIRRGNILFNYIKKFLLTLFIGLILGIVLSMLTGGNILSFMLSFLGGSNIEFRFSILYSLFTLSILMLLIAAIATALGLMNIHKVKAYDIRGGIL